MSSKVLIRLFFSVAISFSIIIIVLVLFLSHDKKLSERHQPYHFAEKFDYSSGSFNEYISYSQRLLRAAQVRQPSEALVQNASPFSLEPGLECPRQENGKYSKGIVLTHGLIASPYSMRELGEYFRSRCFYVLAILMPGHATRPGDSLSFDWQDLVESQHYAVRLLAQAAENIYISGHSAGGTLALYEAAVNPTIDGLILFAPALQVSGAAKYAKWFALLGTVFKKVAWFEVLEDSGVYRYESFSFNAAAQMYELIEQTQLALRLAPITIPVFVVVSKEDNTVSTQATLSMMEDLQNPLSRTLLYSQHSQEKSSEKIRIYNSNVPEQGILSLSHLGLMLPATQTFYGKDGIYHSCKHYVGGEIIALQRCSAGQRDFYGEVSPENLAQGVVERIAFNPFYDEMLIDIDSFLASIVK